MRTQGSGDCRFEAQGPGTKVRTAQDPQVPPGEAMKMLREGWVMGPWSRGAMGPSGHGEDMAMQCGLCVY